MLRHDIVDSPAWKSLSPNARCTWLMITERYNSFNNGDIGLSCREVALELGIGKNTAANAFNALIDRGFVKIARDAGFNMKTGRRARRWRLTHVEFNDQRATSDWRKWSPK